MNLLWANLHLYNTIATAKEGRFSCADSIILSPMQHQDRFTFRTWDPRFSPKYDYDSLKHTGSDVLNILAPVNTPRTTTVAM